MQGATTDYTYNTAGMLISAITDGGSKTLYYYDKNGNCTRTEVYTSDTEFDTTKMYYDTMGRVTIVEQQDENAPVIVKYEYTPAGKISRVIYGLASTTEAVDAQKHRIVTYTYDSLGRLTEETDPMGYKTQYTYNHLNQVVTKTDKNGAVTTYTYDGLGRTTGISAAQEGKATENIAYTYDWQGNITKMVDVSGITQYTYNKRGLLLSETKGDIVKNYTYDANGSRTSFSLPSADMELRYSYTDASRLQAGGLGGMQSRPSRFKGVIGGESELPLCFAAFAIKSRPARQGIEIHLGIAQTHQTLSQT